jgi:hypothetical protein
MMILLLQIVYVAVYAAIKLMPEALSIIKTHAIREVSRRVGSLERRDI